MPSSMSSTTLPELDLGAGTMDRFLSYKDDTIKKKIKEVHAEE